MQGPKLIDGNELEQRDMMRRTAIANMAMEIAKAAAGSGNFLVDGASLARESLIAATAIFDSTTKPSSLNIN